MKLILLTSITAFILVFTFQNCAKYPYTSQDVDLLTLEFKHFYLVNNTYTCMNMVGDTIQTYEDSLYFLDGNVCFSGDGCNDVINCQAWPDGLKVSEDLLSVTFEGKIYYFMKNPPVVN